jgi:phosphoribosyl-AMP cyclohydrolase
MIAMDTYKQGSEYNEEPVEVLEDKSKKIQPKMLIIGIGIVIVGLILSSVFAMVSKNKKTVSKPITKPVVAKSISSNYTEQQVEQLRASGYTGDEIEKYEKVGMNPDLLIAKATQDRQVLLQDTYQELKKSMENSGSSDYKQLIDMTWLCGNPITVSDPSGKFTTQKIKDNIRYVKVPPHGNQLFVKMTLSDGSVAFYSVTPQLWSQLKESGNMIITYDRINYGSNYYIANIEEIPLQ